VNLSQEDLRLLRESFRSAERAREAGNHPFGAILADAGGRLLLEARNTVVTGNDPTAHAESNLVTAAHQHGFSMEDLAGATIFASTEPCPMCAGAIYWGGIGRVVFGLSQAELYALIRRESGTDDAFILPCAEILGRGSRSVEVVGPALEEEARAVHRGFWTQT
jgi:tRNA(Arg) A34 adenosine deaminase TadA